MALGTARVAPVNQIAFSASYCSPENVSLNANSLLVFIIDNSGSNELRQNNSKFYLGTDTTFNPSLTEYENLSRPLPNLRYRKLRDIISSQSDQHSYTLITFSTSAEVIKKDGKKVLTKQEIIEKIDELLNQSNLNSGGTNYILALEKLSENQSGNVGIIEEFLGGIDNLTERDFAYSSVYFFSDGEPIVGNNLQSYSTIYQKLNNFMTKLTYAVNGIDVPVYKSFSTIFYTFPFIEMEFISSENRYVPKIVNGHYVFDETMEQQNENLKENLRNMATIWGKGKFYELGIDLNFAEIGIGNRVEKYQISDPFVLNINATWHFDDDQEMAIYKKDSDKDGLSDDKETELGCNPENNDSNENGIRDGIEGSCNQPPSWNCSHIDKIDGDADGLNLCEEKYLSGLPIHDQDYREQGPDQNNNSVPDYLEAYVGLMLSPDQINLDPDEDGLSNLQEIILNTPIFYHNQRYVRDLSPQQHLTTKILMSDPTEECYQHQIANLRVTPDNNNPEVKMWFKSESFLTGATFFSELNGVKRAQDVINPTEFKPIGSIQ
jgi:hypothetical protein